SLGVTSVYVTHDQVEAMTLADRLIVMNAGVAEQIGAPKEVYERPATTYVAGFIGSPSMNFLAVSVADEGRAIMLPSGEKLMLAHATMPQLNGSRVTLGIRPEHLAVAGEAAPDCFHFQIDVVEELGADTLAHGLMGEGDLVVRLPGHVPVKAGEKLILRPDPEQVHLFDGGSGKRL
ncbi:MAG: TOBE domain-containing protein, partial [Alphaproteobacteria bacterium]|nr:TOBE domain-containing protein [Alphaproteobacteria bacterium]